MQLLAARRTSPASTRSFRCRSAVGQAIPAIAALSPVHSRPAPPIIIGVAAVQWEIGLLEYRDALLRQDDLDLRLDAGAGGAPRLAIGAAGDAPA